jgi:LuxR family maltose regulon positive regulatory protein
VDDGTGGVALATKLYPPRPLDVTVRRERLIERLRDGLRTPLTLVTAPAGWGKSVVVADWISRDRVPAGWVSLDPADSDPMLFWRYVLLAVQSAADAPALPSADRTLLADAASAALRRLGAAGADVERDVLPLLLNPLVGAQRDLVLVLDDFHLVTGTRVPGMLATLLERCPDRLHVVLISRTEPRLPLSRLRLAGRLAELRVRDLAFSVDEASEFFTRQVSSNLADSDVRRVVERTEGWAAGLQLAALRLRDRDDPAAFIARFTGADRHVMDYLSEEVLASLPDDRLRFLLRTSILDQICVPLAEAVTGDPDAARKLDEVARAELFVIRLDDEQRWFRYHHLFGDLLRHELTRTDAGAAPGLHGRAAEWYASAGDFRAAIHHAQAAGDVERVAGYVAAGWRQELNAGRWETIRSWLAALPAERVAGDPELSVAQAWAGLDSGRLDDVAAALEDARSRGTADAHLQVLHGVYAFKVGDLERAEQWLARARPDRRDLFVTTVHCLVSGVVLLWSGRNPEAERLLLRAERLATDDGNGLAHAYALGARALAVLGQGRLHDAEDLLVQAVAELAETMSEQHFIASLPALAFARLRVARQAEDVDARGAARRAVALARRGASRIELAAALLTAADLAAHQPDAATVEESRAWSVEGHELVTSCRSPGPVVASWAVARRRTAGSDAFRSGEPDPLTERELDILRLLPGSLSQRELADSLFVTPNTLKTHLRAIYRKLGVQSRSEAVLHARRVGLI